MSDKTLRGRNPSAISTEPGTTASGKSTAAQNRSKRNGGELIRRAFDLSELSPGGATHTSEVRNPQCDNVEFKI